MSTAKTHRSIIEARKLERSISPQAASGYHSTDLAIYPGQIIRAARPFRAAAITCSHVDGLSPAAPAPSSWHAIRSATVAMFPSSFQVCALPLATVLENVRSPFEARGMPPIDRRKRSCASLTPSASTVLNCLSQGLSGGMKQRCRCRPRTRVESRSALYGRAVSALDVLTAETLRGELLELWLGHKIPTSAISSYSQNRRSRLSPTASSYSAQPRAYHADFKVDIPHPRDRKGVHFLELVDSIYRILTPPDHKDIPLRPAPMAPARRAPKTIMLPNTRPGGMPDFWKF